MCVRLQLHTLPLPAALSTWRGGTCAGLALAEQRVLLHPLLDEQELMPNGEEHVSLRHYELVCPTYQLILGIGLPGP